MREAGATGADGLRGRFRDRAQAGRLLAEALRDLADGPGLVILGLPGGGAVVAAEVAAVLGAPLDVLTVRKIGVPGQEELAMGAVATGEVVVAEREVVAQAGIGAGRFDAAARRAWRELVRREAACRGDRPPLELHGRTVVLVDDGIATGASMLAAVAAARLLGAARVVVAVPTAPAEVCARLAAQVDELVCLTTPSPFVAVGLQYADFSPVRDEDVQALLARDPAHV